jgi:hypothetical protein
MSDDNYSDDLHDGIESRVVDLVLGEASGPEVEELERMVAEQPEVRAFKQRLESLHGLLGETLVPEDDEEWKLAPERRAQLLEALALAGSTGEIPGVDSVIGERARERRIRRAGRRVMWSAAACFVLTLFLVTFLTRPWVAFDSKAGRGANDGKQLVVESHTITLDSDDLSRDADEASFGEASGFSGGKANRFQDDLLGKAEAAEVKADENSGEDAPAQRREVPSSRLATPELDSKVPPQPAAAAPAPPTAAERAADKKQALHPQEAVKEAADLPRADRGPKPKGRSGEAVPLAEVPLEKGKQRSPKSLEKEQTTKLHLAEKPADPAEAEFKLTESLEQVDPRQAGERDGGASLRSRSNSEQAPEVETGVLAEESPDQGLEPRVKDEPERSGASGPTTTVEEKEGPTREVAFLGLGVLLGLVLGLAFGLGLGRTWQRRAQSSH